MEQTDKGKRLWGGGGVGRRERERERERVRERERQRERGGLVVCISFSPVYLIPAA